MIFHFLAIGAESLLTSLRKNLTKLTVWGYFQ